MKLKIKHLMIAALLVGPLTAYGQQRLTLEECRQLAIQNSHEMEQARTKTQMAAYDKKIARANYYPNISATGTYMYNSKNFALVDDKMSETLLHAGDVAQGGLQNAMQGLMQAIQTNPLAAQEYMTSPMWQTVLGALGQTDLSQAINQLGAEIDDLLHPDTQNIFAAAISVQQPVFVGGKIVAANRIATLAEQLSKTQYEQAYQETILSIDQSYWQVVSIASKAKLAESYADLLHKMERDVDVAVAEGVSTESDALQIKVKANEAEMLKTKAVNGLALSKMLLCKQIGLDLNSEIMLADENMDNVPMPQMIAHKSMEDIYADRPEIRSLDIAAQIYDKKTAVARADMMPHIALTANYIYSNPSVFNGFQNKFGGMFNAGVLVNIPIFHAFETTNKVRKAKAEASLYRSQLENAKNLINLQVSQLHKQQAEAVEKFNMAESNLDFAEENLRHATVGFEAGVITANAALSAHTAWLQAHSDYIDAGIEMQINNSSLMKAEGEIKAE